MACMAVALILSALSCKKEKLPATAIYAPNGSVLGASMDDLASRIATVTELESQTLKSRLVGLANNRKYIMPIRTSYAMRMQSNFSQNGHSALPNGGGNGTNTGKSDSQCRIPWKTK